MVHGVRRSRLPFLTAGAVALVLPAVAGAHAASDAATSWYSQGWLVALLALSLAAYVSGLFRLWRSAGIGSGITPQHAGAFVGGWLVLAVALCSPLDRLASQLFLAHMVQHEVLMVLVAPLLVLGRPLAAWTWALSPAARVVVGTWTRASVTRYAWRMITHPLAAFLIHAAALWLWHVPVLFNAALASEGVHALQHASFLFSALLFWWAVLQPGELRMRDAAAVLYLFATMLHTGALGALLTVSTTPWYPTATDSAWGISAIEDQQIGGLIMWIPAATVYIFAALWIMARWLAQSSARDDAALTRRNVIADVR